MANSEYEYVRKFETRDALPPSNWIVVRIDGRGFSKLCQRYDFEKPNDRRALDLMNAAAVETVRSFVDIVLAYGQSDEYSFVFHEATTLFERRASKLATTVTSAFTAEYCLQWSTFFPDRVLERPYPSFDGRCVCYPKRVILRDYLSWRQADCHINNLYNTTFWNMVLKGGMTATEAELELKGTVAADKNEILFKRFGINYNNEPQMYRKGTVVYRAHGDLDDMASSGVSAERDSEEIPTSKKPALSKTQIEKDRKKRLRAKIAVEHIDIIGDAFWGERPYILAPRRGGHV